MADPSDPGEPPLAPRGRQGPAHAGAPPPTASTSAPSAGAPGVPGSQAHADDLRQLEHLSLQHAASAHPEQPAMGAPGSGYAPATAPEALAFSGAPVPANLPTSTAGGERLVAAMEHVDRVVSIFLEDIGRAVAAVRAEVAAEREASLRAVDDAHADARTAAHRLAADAQDFERHRVSTEADLERRWAELRAEQESDKRERARVEREIRDMSQRATAETQAAALVQMQAAQAAQAASLRAALGGDQGLGEMRNESLSAGAYGGFDPAGLGAAGRPVGPRGVAGADAPAATALASGMVEFSELDGYYPTPGGLAAHPDLPPPGHESGAISAISAPPGPELVFAIGGLAKANAPLWTAEVYEAAHGAWRALPEMSAPRGYLAVARGGPGASRVPAHGAASGETARGSDAREPTTVLAIGGSDGERPLRSAEAFDFARGAWRALAPMSAPRIWLGAATVGSRTFAVGGYDGSKYLDLVEAFVPGPEDAPVGSTAAQGRWERCASLSQGRSTAGVASCGGVLYCAGGFCAPHYLSLSEAYDPAADRWWGVAPLPSARRDLGLCALESRQTLVAAGGYDGNAYLGAVDALDPRTNAWRQLAPLRTPRQLIGLASEGDVIFAVGGFDGRETSRTVEVYDARADRWMDAAPMSQPRLGLGVCCV